MAKEKFFAKVGDKLGRITVIEVISPKFILVKCDCGNEKIIQKYNFYRAKHPTRSCGCLFIDQLKSRNNSKKGVATKEYGHAAITVIYKRYREGAKSRNLQFDITRESFSDLILLPCYYCGQEKSLITKTETYDYQHNGVDRLDNTIGYVDGNMVPCCSKCNRAKYKHSAKEYIDMCIRVAERHKHYE